MHEVNQPVHWFLGGKGLGIQQGTSVWVGLSKSLKNPLDAGWGLLPTLRWVGSWLLTYEACFFPSSRGKISQQESNRQPLHLEMGTSPLSPGNLGSSWTIHAGHVHSVVDKRFCVHINYTYHPEFGASVHMF